MPTYDYICDEHGAFTAFKPIARFQEPEPCPACGGSSRRAILTAPAIRGASPAADPSWLGALHKHSAGCGCGKPAAQPPSPGSDKTTS